jgi:hypothetical protein
VKPTRLTYLAKWKSQFNALFEDDFSICTPLELDRLDKIHDRLLKGVQLNTNQTTLLSKLTKRMKGDKK